MTLEYVTCADVLKDIHCLGQLKPLLTYQRYFESAWQAKHLCKHVVQAVPAPPLAFWRKVVRRCVSPLYRHPALVPKDSDGLPGAEVACHDLDDGSITDGDDQVWLGLRDPDMLIDGAWRDFELDWERGHEAQCQAA